MRNRMKKMLAVVLSVVCMVALIGCGGKKEETMQQVMEDKADVTFEGQNMEIEGIEGRILSYSIKNENLYLLTVGRTESEKEEKNHYQFYSSDLKGEQAKCIPAEISETETVVSFCVDENGNLIYLATEVQEEEQKTSLVKTDQNGKELFRTELKKLAKTDFTLMGGMVADKKNQIVLACEETIYFLSEQLEPIGELTAKEGYAIDVALTKNGEIVCVTDKLDSDAIAISVHLLDSEKRKWGESLSVATGLNGEKDCVFDGGEYDFYFKGRNGIYGYTLETKESIQIIDYNASYMTETDTEGMLYANNQIFIGKSEDFTNGPKQTKLVAYEKKDETKISNKRTITLGTFKASPDITKAIALFNRNHSEYQIVLEEYYQQEQEHVMADIASGNMPDIIDLNDFVLSAEQCIAKGMVEDLTPYYENDALCNPDDLLPSVREAILTNGKFYYVTPKFCITTMAARTEDVG